MLSSNCYLFSILNSSLYFVLCVIIIEHPVITIRSFVIGLIYLLYVITMVGVTSYTVFVIVTVCF